jgi:glutathione synthase/RimK-type ligase-like ATP-grasp enzyme
MPDNRCIALVTSKRFPKDNWIDADSVPLAKSLEKLGCEVVSVPWDDSSVDWAQYDLLIMQSPWSVWNDLSSFAKWLDHIQTIGIETFNPMSLLRTGLDKVYLIELAASGIATVPTTYLRPGATTSSADLKDHLRSLVPAEKFSRRSIVVKPASSGGSLRTAEYDREHLSDAVEHVRELHALDMNVLIQPYIQTIDTLREVGVITIGEEISHAISKQAILQAGSSDRAFHPDARPYRQLTSPQREQIVTTRAAFLELSSTASAVPSSLRLDFLFDPADSERLLLLEIESVAPVKFLDLFDGASDRLASTILA